MPNTKSITLHGKSVALPLILSGPLVRKVTVSEVTVWVAVHSPCSVTLQIKNSSTTATNLFQATASTIAIDLHLHIACITVSSEFLSSGTIYFYDIVFSGTGISGSLNKAGIAVLADNDAAAKTAFKKAFCYGTHELPAFALPPEGPDLSKLKIVHGSCRKPHGSGGDALRCLDKLLDDNYSSPDERPQILCLTGDQIYADDLHDKMLELCKGVAAGLMPGAVASTLADRQAFCNGIAFTSTEAKNHLIRFAEFVGMYVLIWSDVLWPADAAQIKALPGSLRNFRAGLPAVRRTLANIPTYMIFDDHEISDDWFRTQKWFSSTYCKTFPPTPLNNNSAMPAHYEAHAIMANGLLAYALFQGWGNLGNSAKFFTPFKEITAITSGNINSNTNLYKLRALMMPGMTNTSDYRWNYLHYNNGNSLWSFRVEFLYFRLVFLDTRTARGYHSYKTPPALVFANHLTTQMDSTIKPLTIVVSASPVFDIEFIEEKKLDEEKADEKDNEAWSHNRAGFLTIQQELSKLGKVVVLSGDVHYGFTNQVEFWDETTKQTALIFQCCASPLKNPPIFLHRKGLTLTQVLTWGAKKAWVLDPLQTLLRKDISDVTDKTRVRYQYRVNYLNDPQYLSALANLGNLEDLMNANGQIVFANHFGLLRFDKGADTATHELYGPEPLIPSRHKLLARHTGVFKKPDFNDRPLQ